MSRFSFKIGKLSDVRKWASERISHVVLYSLTAIIALVFLLFYFVCGLGAAALQMGTQYLEVQAFMNSDSQTALQSLIDLKRTPTVGASGAIYGVLIGYAMLFPQSKMTLLFPPVTLSAKWMVIVFAVIELFTGVVGFADGVAHFAHLGGMLIGWLLIRFWRRRGVLFDRDRL